jgi:hypothetical protein
MIRQTVRPERPLKRVVSIERERIGGSRMEKKISALSGRASDALPLKRGFAFTVMWLCLSLGVDLESMTKTAKTLVIWLPAVCVFAAIAVPRFVTVRVTKAKPACINLLRQIDSAKTSWAQEHHKTTNDTPTWDDLRAHSKERVASLTCPDGGTYSIGRIGESPSCSIAEHADFLRKRDP